MTASDGPALPQNDDAATTDSPPQRQFSLVGSLCLFVGIAILGLLLADRESGLPINMPRTWYVDRGLWVLAGLVGVVLGWRLLRDRDVSPPEPGGETSRHRRGVTQLRPRFERVVLYTRPGCHLCDTAREILEKYGADLPEIVQVDIDTDPNLQQRFSTCIPVVEIDGKVRFRGRIPEILLRRLIAATPPKVFENSSHP